MKLLLRALAISSFFATLPVTSIYSDPSLAEEAGFDFWNVPAYQKRIQAIEWTSQDLEARDKLVVARMAMKMAIAREVIDGKMTFEEGTARFVELNQMHPQTIAVANSSGRRTTEEEAARQLVAHIRAAGGPNARQVAEDWECALSIRQY